MPRRARLVLADVPLHVIQRGNNRQICFFSEADYRFYLECAAAYAPVSGCAVHGYVLMTNHVHLLLTPSSAAGPSRFMKRLGQRYTQYVNRIYQRSGTLWEGRFRSCIVQAESHLLECYRYIDLNPVRAGLVADPAAYRWSSHGANGAGAADPLVVPHPLYLALGRQGSSRQAAYRALIRQKLAPNFIDAVRRATNGNFALGDPAFQAKAASALGRRVTPCQAGRPRRSAPPK